MTHFEGGDQWNFGIYRKKNLRKKKEELFLNSNSHIYTKIIYFIAYFGPARV